MNEPFPTVSSEHFNFSLNTRVMPDDAIQWALDKGVPPRTFIGLEENERFRHLVEESWARPNLDGRLEQTATQANMTFVDFWRYLATEALWVRRIDLVATIYVVVTPADLPARTYQWEFQFAKTTGRLLAHARTPAHPKPTTPTT